MLKETFKMRKIGKHLVNVSMLSLAIAPVVGSALAPATVLAAEQGETRKVEKIPFKTETKDDPTLPKGEKKVIQKGVEGEKEIVTSTKANTKQRARNIILWIDESGSFQNAGGHDYNESLATSIINSLGPNDKMMILGNENTDDMLMLNYSKIFAEPTNDKSKLLAALKKTDGSARSVNVLQNGSMDSLIKAMGVDAKDITLVSLLDDTAITAGQSKTPNYLSEFKSKGGTILGYVPQVPAPGSNKPAFASSTEAALKAVGAKVVKPVEYRDGNAPDVAKQIVDSISNETVTYEPVTTEKVIKEPVNEIIAIGTKVAEPKVTKRTEKIPFKTETKEDPTLPEGEKKVVQKGVEGEKEYVTTTLEDVAGQDGTAEGSVMFTIKATTTEVVKKGANQTVKVSIGGQGVTVTKATLKGAVNKDLPIKEGKVEFSEALADGSYTLEYAAKGNGTLKSLVTVDGKEVGNKTVELKGTPGQKGESKTVENIIKNPINEIIHIGTKGAKSDVTEKKVPFETIRKEDPTLEEGKEKVIQEGVEGVIKVTTTYDTQKGQKVDGSEKVTEKETIKKVDKIIAVGTKGSKSEVTEKKVPFETIKKDDPTLEEGQEKVVQEGVEGVIKVTTTYETQKGEKVKGSEKVTEEKVTDKVDKIIAVGTKGSKSEVTEKKVPFETIYKQDPSLKKGEEKVLQEGVEGVIKVTTTYETQKGKKVDGSEKVTEETVTEKVDKIVAQGTMEKRKVRYRVVDSKGQELVKQTDVMEAYQDEEYKVETPKLDGYRLELAKDSVPATGKVADRDVLVTFVAVKIGKPVTLKFVDESGSEIAEKKVLTGENAEVDTEFTGEAPETIEKDGVKYAFVGIKQTGSKERKVSGKVTDQEQVIEAVYAKPKELPKTSEQAKQRNTAIITLLSVVGLGGLVTYFGLRKRDEK